MAQLEPIYTQRSNATLYSKEIILKAFKVDDISFEMYSVSRRKLTHPFINSLKKYVHLRSINLILISYVVLESRFHVIVLFWQFMYL